MAKRGRSAAFLRDLRRKHGLGEFAGRKGSNKEAPRRVAKQSRKDRRKLKRKSNRGRSKELNWPPL